MLYYISFLTCVFLKVLSSFVLHSFRILHSQKTFEASLLTNLRKHPTSSKMVAFIDNLVAKTVALKEKVFKKKDDNKSVETEDCMPCLKSLLSTLPADNKLQPQLQSPMMQHQSSPKLLLKSRSQLSQLPRPRQRKSSQPICSTKTDSPYSALLFKKLRDSWEWYYKRQKGHGLLESCCEIIGVESK